MRSNYDREPNDEGMLEPLKPSPEWQQMGIQVGFWPFSWRLEAERVYSSPWHIYSLEVGPFQFTVNLGRWPHAE